ncbi:MAG: hypothetical protein AAF696_33900, partial [Bacteroidota bacterium]
LSPFVYVLGVIFDRWVDNLFDRFFKENYENPDFLPREEYYYARTKVYLASQDLKNLLEYGKSRIRICRAWAFNSLMIAFFGFFYVMASPHSPLTNLLLKVKVGMTILLVFGTLALFSFRIWKGLSKKEARFLRVQSKILEELKIKGE